jgi:hypothetical protein
MIVKALLEDIRIEEKWAEDDIIVIVHVPRKNLMMLRLALEGIGLNDSVGLAPNRGEIDENTLSAKL